MPFFKLRKREKKTEEGVQRARRGWFRRVVGVFNSPKIDQEFWDTLEELLISADVGVNTTTKLSEALQERVKKERIGNPSEIRDVLREEMVGILRAPAQNSDFLGEVSGQTAVVLVVGVNGGGKTTSIAKLAYAFREEDKKVVLAAADTFRAAAIEQLNIWGERVGAEVIAHQSGSDPAAVVFDALHGARSREAEVVLIDTAGRLHTKHNLMEELKKMKRVVSRFDSSAPHEVLLVMDAVTGQNGLVQARHFVDAVGVTGIFLAKLDGTAKGGIVLNICDELNIPIRFIGTGEGPEDMAPFDPEVFVNALFE
ncbi:MAG: signal recognition particle-docking protein FtsY [Dehalococcoidia bacterium]